jgi:hypothetical protein
MLVMIAIGNSVCLLVAVDDSFMLMLSLADKVTIIASCGKNAV